jgi:ABC-type bacteriocin/lantibiotic exporter with double-glycine peptidase domain
MTDLLTVEDMEVRYGSAVAAQRISLVVPQRGTVGLLGANGAGKSTVLKAIAGLIPKSAGRLLLEGTDVTGQDARQLVRAGIVYVPEGREIVPDDLRLDLRRAFEDVQDAGVAQHPADLEFQRVAVAAMDLQAQSALLQATRAASSLAIPASMSQRRPLSFSVAAW